MFYFCRSNELDFEDEVFEDFPTESSVDLIRSQKRSKKIERVVIKTVIDTTGITFYLQADEVRGNEYITVSTDHRSLSFRSILVNR